MDCSPANKKEMDHVDQNADRLEQDEEHEQEFLEDDEEGDGESDLDEPAEDSSSDQDNSLKSDEQENTTKKFMH